MRIGLYVRAALDVYNTQSRVMQVHLGVNDLLSDDIPMVFFSLSLPMAFELYLFLLTLIFLAVLLLGGLVWKCELCDFVVDDNREN